jgi:NADH:ubiquinone oxidoreductase subunit 4 (subunit M)
MIESHMQGVVVLIFTATLITSILFYLYYSVYNRRDEE